MKWARFNGFLALGMAYASVVLDSPMLMGEAVVWSMYAIILAITEKENNK